MRTLLIHCHILPLTQHEFIESLGISHVCMYSIVLAQGIPRRQHKPSSGQMHKEMNSPHPGKGSLSKTGGDIREQKSDCERNRDFPDELSKGQGFS